VWTTTGTRTVFHNEGGIESRPKVYKVQVRPDAPRDEDVQTAGSWPRAGEAPAAEQLEITVQPPYVVFAFRTVRTCPPSGLYVVSAFRTVT